ncbi:MAG: sugar porter family MFS transporter [Pirellulaceae bacterium]
MVTLRRGTGYVFGIAFVASVGGFLFGYDLAIMGGANRYLQQQFRLSEAGFGFTTASATLGCAMGPFLGAWLCDRFGRRRTLIGASLLLGVGAVLTALPRDIYTFNVFRIVGGVGVGLCSIASPMYIAEVAPPKNRGGLGFMYQLAIVAGCVLSIYVAYLLADWFPPTTNWRWMFGSEMVAILVFLIFLIMIPETPRWLAARGLEPQAIAVLKRIGGVTYAREQIEEIRKSLNEETGTWGELWEPGMKRALAVGVLLAIFNNYTGWSGIYNYLPTIFLQAGFLTTSSAIFQYMLAFAFMGAMTLIACFVVDRLGRRPLWIAASALMIGANILVGILFQLNVTGFMVLLGICLLAIPHSFALGPLPWLMMSELYPTRIRARAVSITTTVLWITSFFPVFLFPFLQRGSEYYLGTVAGVFWIYAGICVFSLLFGFGWLPETKGRTLEAIADSWKRDHPSPP